jgi:hypothetical protein
MNHAPLPLALLLASLFAAAPAFADEFQADKAGELATKEVRRVIQLREPGPLGLAGAGLRMDAKVVRNLPYSAEVISERQQNLADGNQIVRRTTSLSYRDSAGRTRQELRDDKGELRTITIHDPVAGETLFLDPRSKTATRISPRKIAQAAKVRIEMHPRTKSNEERRQITLRRSDNDEDNVVVSSSGPLSFTANEMRSDARRPNEMILGPLGGSFADIKWSSKATSKELGTRDIDGVRAEGKLRSYDIPAGAIGNRNPITVNDESWYAPELQITVLTKHSDPRIGDNVYRLAAIKREEPAPSLFAVPSDYTVKEPMANMPPPLEKREPRGETPAR